MAALLDAGAGVFAEYGYEAATMTAVAQRAACSIGALYQYFKDKEALAQVLRGMYADEMRKRWSSLVGEAAGFTLDELAGRIVELMVVFVAGHPAYLVLLGAPVGYRRDALAGQQLREQLAGVLIAYQPGLQPELAYRWANVALQIVKSLMPLYAAAADAGERDLLTAEFKAAVGAYLRTRMASREAGMAGALK